MDPDNSYREEAPFSMASRSADDENDSNTPGRSSSESAFLKTKGRCLKIGTESAHFSKIIVDHSGDHRSLWKAFNKILNRCPKSVPSRPHHN